MRTKLQEGAYPTWNSVQTDLETMFNNAMVFNAPTTPYHTKARPPSSRPDDVSSSACQSLTRESSGRQPAPSLCANEVLFVCLAYLLPMMYFERSRLVLDLGSSSMCLDSGLFNYYNCFLQARELMGIARKRLQSVKATGQLDARGRKSGAAAKPPPAAPPASLAPLSERRTERRSAAGKQEKAAKPK